MIDAFEVFDDWQLARIHLNSPIFIIVVEKAAFAAIDASDDEFDKYEELEDDFMLLANEG